MVNGERGMIDLGGFKTTLGVAYWDSGMRRWYLCSEAEVASFGNRLERGDEGAYSRWCADMAPVDMSERIEALAVEAMEARDEEQARLCREALGGDEGAMRACVRALSDAEAARDG